MNTLNILIMISVAFAILDNRVPDRNRVICSVEQIKRYNNAANDVALVNIKRIKRVRDLAGLYLYEVRAKVEFPLKGVLKAGGTINFHVEAAYEYNLAKGKTFVFLNRTFDENGSIIRTLQINDIGAKPGMCPDSPGMMEVIKNLMKAER
jgi:hypothetical protein